MNSRQDKPCFPDRDARRYRATGQRVLRPWRLRSVVGAALALAAVWGCVPDAPALQMAGAGGGVGGAGTGGVGGGGTGGVVGTGGVGGNGAGAVADASGDANDGPCIPETNAAFCSRIGKNCGTATAYDNCGTSRTVASCGTCTLPQVCDGKNICCTPETDAAFCSRLGKKCGSFTASDNCGASRAISSCGTCADAGMTCVGGECLKDDQVILCYTTKNWASEYVACASHTERCCLNGTACSPDGDGCYPIAMSCDNCHRDITCDGPEDCQGGVCCDEFRFPAWSKVTKCKTACAAGEIELCHPGPSPCSTPGATCVTADAPPMSLWGECTVSGGGGG
jgi:hypothetical protein